MHAAGAYSMADQMPQAERVVDPYAGDAERQYATFNHLIGLLSLADFMVLGLIGAIIMWRVKCRTSPFLDDHGREAVNFQISLLIYTLAFGLFMVATLGIGAILMPVFVVAMLALRLVGCVRGSMAANRGEYYRYPMCMRFLS